MIDKKYVALRAIKMQQIKFYSCACFSTLQDIWFRGVTIDFSFEIEWQNKSKNETKSNWCHFQALKKGVYGLSNIVLAVKLRGVSFIEFWSRM